MILYDFAKSTVLGLLTVVWRIRAYDVRNVPLDGPLIVACNHVSNLDPPALGCVLPRRLRYMAKQELFDVPVLGALIGRLGAYPVDRHGSAAAAIKRSVEILRAGGAVGIFPEGGRNLEGTNEVRQGVALLASLGRAPVLPACVIGTRNPWALRRIKVAFGTPLRLPSDRKATREEMANFTDSVMNEIRALAVRYGH